MNTLFTLGASLFQTFGLIIVVWFAFVGLLSGPRALERMVENLFSSVIKQLPKLLRTLHRLVQELSKAIVRLLPYKYRFDFLEVLVQAVLGMAAFWLFIHR